MEKENNEKAGLIPIIKPDTVIDISVSSGFYIRMQNMFNFLTDGKSSDEIKDAFEQIQKDDIKEEWIEHIDTILRFCNAFELKVQELNLVEFITVEEYNNQNKD